MKLSLIIPCYNEAQNLPLLFARCSTLGDLENIEIIFVDNGSTDSTASLLENFLRDHPYCHTVRVPVNQGYGFGIFSGLKVAKGDILSWTHADMQTDPKDVLDGLELFKIHGNNIYVKGKRIKRPLVDWFFTIGMSIFETCLLRSRLWDINAQPNMFPRDFFETWQNPPNDFSLDLYAYYMARNQGLPIYRFPVKFCERTYGISSWNIGWKRKIIFIRRIIKFSFDLRKRLTK